MKPSFRYPVDWMPTRESSSCAAFWYTPHTCEPRLREPEWMTSHRLPSMSSSISMKWLPPPSVPTDLLIRSRSCRRSMQARSSHPNQKSCCSFSRQLMPDGMRSRTTSSSVWKSTRLLPTR